MNYRFMRLILFFDLPMEKASERHEYAVFRKLLLKNGFMMMQKSVYTRLVINNMTSEAVKNIIRKNIPKSGLVEMLEITENQFGRIEYLLGERNSGYIDSMERLVEI